MAGLHLYQGNRLETLAEELERLLRGPSTSPVAALRPEIIVVQSLGMRRWLSLTLARALGVTMNVRFPFPADLLQHVFRAIFQETSAGFMGERGQLSWRVLQVLPALLAQPEAAPLARYLEGEMRPLKEFQIAEKIALVIDRYLAYRPEMVLAWDALRGPSDDWQLTLWRLLRGLEKKPVRAAHAPALAAALRSGLDRGTVDFSSFGSRLVVFGISSLPPLYLDLLGQIARQLEVHFFQLQPTEHYWGDVLSRKDQDRLLRKKEAPARSAESHYLTTGNPLLASWGKIGRDFSDALLDLEPVREAEFFFPPDSAPQPTLLAHLQARIFDLQEAPLAQKIDLSRSDLSVQIHACHSPMRELEILHDQLLALFEKVPTLTPREVLVTMPDVETYAPLIEAVFGSIEDPAQRFPYSIADRPGRAESPLVDAFLRILALAGSRLPASAVAELLELPAICARFGLASSDPSLIRDWIAQSGIRWGLDASHRAELGLPAFAENSWQFGLRRLLLGYAFAGDGKTLFSGILPIREIEGSLAETLGRFVDFADTLFTQLGTLREPRSASAWAETLRTLLAALLADSAESGDEIRRLRHVLDLLGAVESEGGLTADLDFSVIRAHLETAFQNSENSTGFLAGRITFCALKPMRSIPFRVICLLGMNDTAFPRHESALAFDRVAQEPRRGDRSLREDDRQLFLETLLSARDALYISFCGQSAKDNSALPPSVLVSELLEEIGRHFTREGSEITPPSFIVAHRLQPFSAAYFRRGPLFSYSQENCRAGRERALPREFAGAFARDPLPAPGPEWLSLDAEKLADFFAHPSRFFCRQRLGLALPDEATALLDREPEKTDKLVRYRLEQTFTDRALAASAERISPQQHPVWAATRASGELPPGYLGESEFAEVLERSSDLAMRIRARIEGAPLPPWTLDLTLGDFRISGTLRQIFPSAMLRYRSADLKAKDLLRAWIAHLLLQLAEHPPLPRKTWLLATDRDVRFAAVHNARERLQDLLEIYRWGLTTPLPFFPKTSLVFARATLLPSKREKKSPLAQARQTWFGNDFQIGEARDRCIARCFGIDLESTPEPLDDTWSKLALRIYEPLLAASTEQIP